MEPMEYQGSVEQFLCEKATVNHTPINAILELTPLCNMNCDMCFVRLSPEEMKRKGCLRTTEEWISLGKEMYDAGTLFVLLTGGEPLLYPEFREVYFALKKMGMILTVNTNGTLINEEWADFFAKYTPRRINITLYGKDEHTYQKLCHYSEGFDKTIKAIRLLQERGVDVKVNGSITTENIDDLEELFSIVDQMGVVWKFDTYMYPASRERGTRFDYSSRLMAEKAAAARVKVIRKKEGRENFCAFARKFLERDKADPGEYMPPVVKCRAGSSSFVINWQGEMRPCIMMSEPSVSVIKYGFQASWEKLVQDVAKIRLSSECSVCPHREVCQTCAACAFLESGSYNGVPDYMCRYTKETIRLLEQEQKKMQKNLPEK